MNVRVCDDALHMSDHNPDEYLPVESAGNVAGIPPRTLRYWIKDGKLPAIAGQRGKLVRLGDVLAMADLTGKSAMPSRQTSGNVGNPATFAEMPAGNVAGNDDEVAVSPAAVDQLEAIRDRWLQPLIDQIRELEHNAGRLEVRAETAERERDELAAEVQLLREIHTHQVQEPEPVTAPLEASPASPGREEAPAMASDTLHPQSRVTGLVRRLLRRS